MDGEARLVCVAWCTATARFFLFFSFKLIISAVNYFTMTNPHAEKKPCSLCCVSGCACLDFSFTSTVGFSSAITTPIQSGNLFIYSKSGSRQTEGRWGGCSGLTCKDKIVRRGSNHRDPSPERVAAEGTMGEEDPGPITSRRWLHWRPNDEHSDQGWVITICWLLVEQLT